MNAVNNDYKVIRRTGEVVTFDEAKIRNAVINAFLKDEHGESWTPGKTSLSASERDQAQRVTTLVVDALVRRRAPGGAIHIEDIQDQVELALMREGLHTIARAYVLYRERQAQARAQAEPAVERILHVRVGDTLQPLDIPALRQRAIRACAGLADVDPEAVVDEALKNLYEGIPVEEVSAALIMTARTRIEREPNYHFVTARLMLDDIKAEVLGKVDGDYIEAFPALIRKGIAADRLDPKLGQFDLERLAQALRPERDQQFRYQGLQILYDRYFIHVDEQRIELPQTFWMRVAMGLAVSEIDREARAIEFYEVLSSFDFVSSTPTLFNAGTLRPQLSSCFLTTVSDDLDGIYNAIKENALLSKFSGGLGNDWTPVRALGAYIKGTNGIAGGFSFVCL